MRSSTFKTLLLEPLENRNLLAGDCMLEMTTPPPQESAATALAFVGDSIALGQNGSLASASDADFQAANSDAGATRSTAHNLGSLQAESQGSTQRSLEGSLSYLDRMDVFRFEVSGTTELDLNLAGMWGNADLILADSDGQGIATSRNSGIAAESIRAELSAGVYYVGVQARSFWGTSYQLEVSASFATPEPVPPATPPTQGDQDSGDPDNGNGAGQGGDPGSPSNPGNQVEALPDVAYFGGSRDWNVNAVNAPEAWAAGYTGQGITVAVVDTGVDLDHPDLVSNLYVNPGEIPGNGIDDDQNGYVDDVSGYDFVSNDANPDDRNGHGTHVAGTIASANNGVGSTGVAPDAKILPVKVLSDNGSGSNFSVAAGIRYAADMGAQVINLSLGGGYSSAVHSAISYANSLGSIVIAAAGNEGASVPSFPAQLGSTLDNVISVGAHNSSNQTAGFSNRVGGSNAVQIDAPGVGVFSTYAGGRYGSLSGTSMASPHVAGVAALALSANPDLTPSELRGLLQEGATDQAIGSDAVGIVNAATTVAYATAGLSSASASSQTQASFRGNARSTRAISTAPVAVPPVDAFFASAFRVNEMSTSQSERPVSNAFVEDVFRVSDVAADAFVANSNEQYGAPPEFHLHHALDQLMEELEGEQETDHGLEVRVRTTI